MGHLVKVRKNLQHINDLRKIDEALDYVLKKIIRYTTSFDIVSTRNYVLFTSERIKYSSLLDDEQITGLSFFLAEKLEQRSDMWEEKEVNPLNIGNYCDEETKRILWISNLSYYVKFFIKAVMQCDLGDGTLLNNQWKATFSPRYRKKNKEVSALNDEFYKLVEECEYKTKYASEDIFSSLSRRKLLKTKKLMQVLENMYNKYTCILEKYGKE